MLMYCWQFMGWVWKSAKRVWMGDVFCCYCCCHSNAPGRSQRGCSGDNLMLQFLMSNWDIFRKLRMKLSSLLRWPILLALDFPHPPFTVYSTKLKRGQLGFFLILSSQHLRNTFVLFACITVSKYLLQNYLLGSLRLWLFLLVLHFNLHWMYSMLGIKLNIQAVFAFASNAQDTNLASLESSQK